MILLAVVWGGFGLILGSFTNVLIVRHGERSILGRSHCPHCKRALEWYELVPILSYIVLRGKCRTCHIPISPQYPLVEALIAAGFIIVGLSPQIILIRLLGCAIIVLLVAIAVYDTRHTIIPDIWVYSFTTLAFASGLLTTVYSGSGVLLFLVAGPVLALPLAGLWFFSSGAWMGFGDVKFALGIGWLLGILNGYIALTLAFVIGAIIGVCILLPLRHIRRVVRYIEGFTQHLIVMYSHLWGQGKMHKILSPNAYSAFQGAGFTMHSEVPFGPFLIVGLCVVWISQLYAFDIASFLVGLLSLS